MRSLPTGTITFLYTDIEGSTRLWQRAPSLMPAALDRHNAILHDAIASNEGVVFRTVGDAFCAAFSRAGSAIAAAVSAQGALQGEPWPDGAAIAVRMAVHAGTAEVQDGDYVGHTLNRVARLLSAGHGGQVLLSSAAEELTRDALPAGVSLIDLGEHRLKDLIRPEHIYQLCAPDLPQTFPPLLTLDSLPTNLPVQSTLFIGREREVEAVAQMVRKPEVRLLTLTGPGGTGKTRLSLQVGAEVLDAFPDGVYFVPLGEVLEGGRVPAALMDALALKAGAGQEPEEALRSHLRDRHLLLILDNFEQVIDAAPLVSRLLSAAPGLTILVTSRAVLHISGEREYAVPTLSVPDMDCLPSLEALSQYDAVALFIDRATAVKADFGMTNENAPSVAEICARLDGLPLAIELAASRVRLFPPQALLGRLQNRLKLLTGGARDLPARQQTLRGAIDWSYSLLDEAEQTLFARFSVFAGSFTLEAAEAICDPDGELAIDVLDGISSLVEKSLLRQEGDEPRFVMLNTIREYAQERLTASGEADGVRQRHAEYFLERARLGHLSVNGWRETTVALEELIPDRDNFTTALTWVTEQGDAETAMFLAGHLCWVWSAQGSWKEGRDWSDRALALARPGEHMQARACVLEGSGLLASVIGNFSEGLRRLEEAREIYEALGLSEEQTLALLFAGIFYSTSGAVERGREYLERGLVQAREQGRPWPIGFALNALSQAYLAMGDLVTARAMAEESIRIIQTQIDPNTSLHIYNAMGDIARLEEKYDEARRHYTRSLEITDSYGFEGFAPSLRHNLAWISHDLGDDAAAVRQFTQALEQFRRRADERGIAECLIGLGCSWSVADPNAGVRMMAAGFAILDGMNVPLTLPNRPDYERCAGRAREALGEEGWRRSWEAGSGLSVDGALSLVKPGAAAVL